MVGDHSPIQKNLLLVSTNRGQKIGLRAPVTGSNHAEVWQLLNVGLKITTLFMVVL